MHPDTQLKEAVTKGFDPKSLYDPNLDHVKEPVRSILEEYSQIPANEILAHVQKLRDTAFAIFPYACVGQFSFLELSIASSPCYPEILRRVKDGEKLLDLGCAFGQELRRLIYDGAPHANLYGSDLRPEFLQLGCDLFLDHERMNKQLIPADIVDERSELIARVGGQIDMVYISLFLHVFDWDKQVVVAKRVFSLMRAKPGSMIVCRVVACRDQAVLNATQTRMPYYYHDLASWNRLWEKVQEQTGFKLDVQSWEQPDELAAKHPIKGIYVLGSSIRRL
uniref:Putative methyltransferase n=1 Tax=Emericella variicolor TaxID=1549217 RepID=A0A1L7NQ67_EMEVA|nr:putative methyltransferase [Aspergillus stellatus]